MTKRSKEELLAEIATLTARKARVDGLYQDWNRLSAVSRAAAEAIAMTAWQPDKAREAFANYLDASKAADLAYAKMIAEMGDRRFHDGIDAEQLQTNAVSQDR